MITFKKIKILANEDSVLETELVCVKGAHSFKMVFAFLKKRISFAIKDGSPKTASSSIRD